MGLREIENKITEEAQIEADRIKAEALAKTEEIRKDYQQKSRQEYDQIIKQAHLKAEALKKSIIVPARLNAKKSILAAKHEILDEVFKNSAPHKKEDNIEKAANILFQ